MQQFGDPAGSLRRAQRWNPQRAQLGVHGELATARVLTDALKGRPDVVVFHDVRIPAEARTRDGALPNLDHIVVRDNRLLVIDSGCWQPGIYWSFRGRTRRGSEAVPFADKVTFRYALGALRSYLGDTAVAVDGVIVVHPSRPGLLSLRLVRRPDDITLMGARRLSRTARMLPSGTNHPELLHRLHALLVTPRAGA